MRQHAPRPDLTLWLIAGGALVLRVVYTLAWGQDVHLGLSDAGFYTTSANLLADGEGYVDLFRSFDEDELVHTAHHPPGWPALLAVFSVLGVDTELGHRLVGCLVGAVVVLLVGLLGQRIGGRRAGLVAAGLAAVHPTLVAADGSLMAESAAGLVVLVVLLLAFAVVDRPAWWRAVLLGAAIGAASLVRAEALVYVALVVVPIGVALARRADRRTAAQLAALSIAGIVLVVAPWTIRNTLLFDRLVPISINDSTVLAGANCEATYYGPNTGAWAFGCVADPGEGLDEADEAAIWRDDGLDYARAHLDRLPAVLGMRLARTFGVNDLTIAAEGRHRGTQIAGNVVWLLVLVPGAIAGGLLLGRRRQRLDLVLLLAPVVATIVVTLVGFGMLRFRHSTELVAIVLTAVAVTSGIARNRFA